MVLSQNAVTACILLNGHDPCIVPVKYLTFHLSSKWRESVRGLGNNDGLTAK